MALVGVILLMAGVITLPITGIILLTMVITHLIMVIIRRITLFIRVILMQDIVIRFTGRVLPGAEDLPFRAVPWQEVREFTHLLTASVLPVVRLQEVPFLPNGFL